MAGKVKDLFVVLAEQHRSRSDASRLGGNPDGGDGGGLVDAVRGAVKGLRGEATRLRPSAGREPRTVPRGLLVPGWLLAAMVVLALGGGFAVGRATARGQPAESLSAGTGAAKPGAFSDEAPGPGRLAEAEEEKELYRGMLFQLKGFYGDQRAEAAMLAEQLRGHGLRDARIRFVKKGSDAYWLTVCYVDPPLDDPDAFKKFEKAILARIREFEGRLGFTASPEIKDPYRKD